MYMCAAICKVIVALIASYVTNFNTNICNRKIYESSKLSMHAYMLSSGAK